MQTILAIAIVFTVVIMFVRKHLRKHNGCGCLKCNCKDDQ